MLSLLQTDYGDMGMSSYSQTQLPAWFWPVYGVVIIFYIFCMWRVYTKCGEPGWAAIVPIYNLYVLCRMVHRPKHFMWMLLALSGYIVGFAVMMASPAIGGLLVAIAGISLLVISIMVYHGLSLAFGQGAGFTVGLILLSFIFIPMLAFGNYQYVLNSAPSAGGDVLDA